MEAGGAPVQLDAECPKLRTQNQGPLLKMLANLYAFRPNMLQDQSHPVLDFSNFKPQLQMQLSHPKASSSSKPIAFGAKDGQSVMEALKQNDFRIEAENSSFHPEELHSTGLCRFWPQT